ncbi:MAG: cellulase family glycosylhydrolase [Pirellulales bacterium]
MSGRKVLAAEPLPWVAVSDDGQRLVVGESRSEFVVRGFNYDHDRDGRLIEDYWDDDWRAVVDDFAEMKRLRANVVRIHLQLGRFMAAADTPNTKSLDKLTQLLKLAESTGLYLDITGLGCYHRVDVPGWYDQLDEQERWNVQATFWRAIAERCADSPAVFCYDLMNEPVVPGGRRTDRDWLGPPFAGKHFVQFITLDQKDRPRTEIARAWTQHLVAAVREVDRRHLITVGLVDWSLDRPGLTSGFQPDKLADEIDFVSVHLYPETGKMTEAMETLNGFRVGKPVVVEETFPLRCRPDELVDFIRQSKGQTSGWISFYWGQTREELAPSNKIGDVLLRDWLDQFPALLIETPATDR